MIAAAGTGGHVYPGLAVAEALVTAGVAREEVLCVGGDRVEAKVYPEHGFGFVELELRGLRRSLSPSNLTLPRVVLRARARILEEMASSHVSAVLGMGGYVTIPAAMAARKAGSPLMIAEQNAGAGLANRIAARWATRVFASFPDTEGLPGAEWVGNPVREEIARFDRASLREPALTRYGFSGEKPVVGVFGGSLGAMAINDAVAAMATEPDGRAFDIVHLVGSAHEEAMGHHVPRPGVNWARRGFEDRMDLFFAACDLVIARAGGSVAEIVATGTPAILIPGEFGSAGHQEANARFLELRGAAVVIPQGNLADLNRRVDSLLDDPERLQSMAEAAARVARPDAAEVIARAMIEAA